MKGNLNLLLSLPLTAGLVLFIFFFNIISLLLSIMQATTRRKRVNLMKTKAF
jgi:hypothetical protein